MKSQSTRHYVDEVVTRKPDDTDLRYDRINQYSYIRIIEQTPEKIAVDWRYAPELNPKPDLSKTRPDSGKVGLNAVVHEACRIYKDGVLKRGIVLAIRILSTNSSCFCSYVHPLAKGLRRPVWAPTHPLSSPSPGMTEQCTLVVTCLLFSVL